IPPIVRNKVASAASSPASQTRRFESTLLMSLAASAAGASVSASAAVSASASVSFLVISSFSVVVSARTDGTRASVRHRGAPRLQDQVGGDLARPPLERVAADLLPGVAEDQRPQLVAVALLEDDALGQAGQPGRERLEHDSRRERLLARDPNQRPQQRVFGR